MKKILLYLAVFVLLILAFLYGMYRWVEANAFSRSAGSSNIVQIFEAKEGDGSTEIGQNLESQGLVLSKNFFYYYVWKTKTSGKLQAGEYELAPNMTIPQIVEKLSKGEVKPKIVKLTVPEGFSNSKIIALLEKEKPSLAKDFAEIVNCKCLNREGCACDLFGGKYDFLQAIPEGVDMEGYLFPDTYFIDEADTAMTLVGKFLNNYSKKVVATFGLQEGALHEKMIIASLLEREIPNSKDRTIVSGIIKKRLEIEMPLQIDATICYIKEPETCLPIRSEELESESPYNTYKNKGLPPGPIGNPGIDSIQAALNPEQSDFLFYLSDPQTKQTIFSVNYDQHLLNINKYLRSR